MTFLLSFVANKELTAILRVTSSLQSLPHSWELLVPTMVKENLPSSSSLVARLTRSPEILQDFTD